MLNGHQKRRIITVIREVLDESPPLTRDPINCREDALALLARADQIAAQRESG